MASIEDLREQIEATHQDALRALDTLAKYFGKNGRTPEQKLPAKRRKRKSSGSIRDKVLDAIRDWATTDDVMTATGLKKRQVRGVLNAPGLGHSIERRDVDGKREYRYTKGKE